MYDSTAEATADTTGAKVTEKVNEAASNAGNESVLAENPNATCRIGTTAYSSLEEAIANVKENETISLVANLEYENTEIIVYKGVNEVSFTLDGCNKTITAKKGTTFQSKDNKFMNLEPMTKNCCVTIKNLSLNVNDYEYALIFNSCDSGKYCAYGSITNSVIVSEGCCLGVSGNDFGNGIVDIYDCTFTETESTDNWNSYIDTVIAPQYDGRVNIYGGTYTGTKYSVYIFTSGGIATIDSGSFKADTVLMAGYSSTYSEVHEGSEITVNGGSFSGNVGSVNGTTEKIIINSPATVTGTLGENVTDNR